MNCDTEESISPATLKVLLFSAMVVPDLIQAPGGFTYTQKAIIPGDRETGAS